MIIDLTYCHDIYSLTFF